MPASTILRGIFALIIMIFHISKETDFFYPLFHYFSITVVGAFFFLSGYGLMTANLNKKQYYKDFLKNRLTKLFLPYLFMTFIYWIYYTLADDPRSLSFVLRSILGNATMVMYSWFIKYLIISYFEFYLLMLLFRDNKQYMLYTAYILLTVNIICSFMKIKVPYLLDEMFCLGMLFAGNRQIIEQIRRYKWLLLPACLILTVLIETGLLRLHGYAELPQRMLFILMILTLGTYTEIRNPFFAFAGRISLELYMTHGLAKAVIRRFYGGPLFVQDFIIYVLAFFLSYMLYLLFGAVGKRIRSHLA